MISDSILCFHYKVVIELMEKMTVRGTMVCSDVCITHCVLHTVYYTLCNWCCCICICVCITHLCVVPVWYQAQGKSAAGADH